MICSQDEIESKCSTYRLSLLIAKFQRLLKGHLFFEPAIVYGQGSIRVAVVDRDQLLLFDQAGHFLAKLAASYLYRHHLSHELACVGDWVCVEKQPCEDFGVIHALLERRTSLRRKSAGDVIDYQMIAANPDCVVIVQSCHFDFNLRRLERDLVMVMDGGAQPYILLTITVLAGKSRHQQCSRNIILAWSIGTGIG